MKSNSNHGDPTRQGGTLLARVGNLLARGDPIRQDWIRLARVVPALTRTGCALTKMGPAPTRV